MLPQDAVPEDSSAFGVKVTLDLTRVTPGSVIQDTALHPLVLTLYAELAVKWTLNAVSTGAHIIKGKVFNNIMIDLKPRLVLLLPGDAAMSVYALHVWAGQDARQQVSRIVRIIMDISCAPSWMSLRRLQKH